MIILTELGKSCDQFRCITSIIILSLQAQMVRRVKSYLKNMKIVTDYKMKDYEERLHQMSEQCEAPVGGIPPTLSLAQHSVS